MDRLSLAAASSTRTFTNRTFFCPAPLVYAEPTDNDDYYIVWALESQGCASPCPTLTYTHDEWQLLKDILIALSLFCLVASILSSVVLAGANIKKFFIKLMFTCGFLFSSIVSVLFFVINYDDEVICQGDAYFYRRAPFCVFQAASLTFLFLWIQLWGVFLCLETYFFFLGKARQKIIQRWRQYYTRIAVVLPTILTLIPLLCRNLGFDPYATLPVCLFLFHDNKNFFWFGLYIPFFILNAVSSVITILSIKRIHEVFVSVNDFSNKNLKSPKSKEKSSSSSQSGNFLRESSLSEYSEQSGFSGSVLQASLIDGDALSNCHSIHHDKQALAVLPEQQLSHDRYSLYDDQDSELDRDSFGKTLLRQRKDSSLSLDNDDPFPCSDLFLPFADDQVLSAEAASEANDRDTVEESNYSTGSWIKSTLSKLGNRKRFFSAFRKTMRYNGRSIVFIITFCLSTFYIAVMLFILNYVQYDKNLDGSEDFVECLLEASFRSPYQTQEEVNSYAQDICGKYPSVRPGKYEFFSILLWAYGYGIVPCVVFASSTTVLLKFKSRCFVCFSGSNPKASDEK